MNAITTTTTAPNRPMTSVLLDLAASSALLRLQRKLQGEGRPAERLDATLRYSMGKLGRLCQRVGQDIRSGPFWTLLEHPDCYEAAFENHRPVVLDELTPRAIYDGVSRGNHLYWQGWQIYRGEPEEITDAYGLPAWGSYVWLQSPDGTLSSFEGVSKAHARDIYRSIAGSAFAGDDDLGLDAPHPAENIPWYVASDGTGLWPFDLTRIPQRVQQGALA